MLSFDQKFTVSPGVLSQEVDGETVLLDMNSENYFGLDEVGTRIWQLLSEKKTIRQVVDKLLDEYHADEFTLKEDVAEFVQLLIDAGLVSSGSGTGDRLQG
jgi:hypothetical protein